MNDYLNYNAIDFAEDSTFLTWVKHPGKEFTTDHFWQSWVSTHPEKQEEVEEARRMILAIVEDEQRDDVELKQKLVWAKLQQSINATRQEQKKSYTRLYFRIAASVLIVSGVVVSGWWLYSFNHVPANTEISAGASLIKEYNNSTLPKTIVLGDGSSIILEPNSALEFPRVFETNYREVRLSGEAFFEVAKDAKRPFLVYADKLITKVLGTSFTIRAVEGERNVSVQVMTGKVSVYTAADANVNQNKGNAQLEGVLLIPNQQVVFIRDESRLVKSLVENPTLLNGAAKNRFVFQDMPLKKVFQNIEEAYGVDIVFDEEAMRNCLLNATLDDMPLYEKMRLICKGINAQYEIMDSHIIISGKGCN